jgi:1-acyl-sn-glycerol-3-phosphate acyltransferase
VVNRPEILKLKGPVLFACNHPNSFLDGMILTTLYDETVHSLARGDVFKKPWMNRFLRFIKLLPVYRTSEGVENLEFNYITFDACLEAFKKNESVLIFSEGRCENEWHLRPLKKGTARLAFSAWNLDIPLIVIPAAFNYSSFKSFGKEVHLLFGDPLILDPAQLSASNGVRLKAFNEALNSQLKELVYEIKPQEKEKLRQYFPLPENPLYYALWLPAIMGWILHAPLYYACKAFTQYRFGHSGHYDSVITSLLLLSYPAYLILIAFLFYLLAPLLGLFTLLLMPITAWAAIRVKYQLRG